MREYISNTCAFSVSSFGKKYDTTNISSTTLFIFCCRLSVIFLSVMDFLSYSSRSYNCSNLIVNPYFLFRLSMTGTAFSLIRSIFSRRTFSSNSLICSPILFAVDFTIFSVSINSFFNGVHCAINSFSVTFLLSEIVVSTLFKVVRSFFACSSNSSVTT